MQKIVRENGTGKTKELMELATSCNGLFVCADPHRAAQKAYGYGLGVLRTISYLDYIKMITVGEDFEPSDKVFIDDVSKFMETMDSRISGFSETQKPREIIVSTQFAIVSRAEERRQMCWTGKELKTMDKARAENPVIFDSLIDAEDFIKKYNLGEAFKPEAFYINSSYKNRFTTITPKEAKRGLVTMQAVEGA